MSGTCAFLVVLLAMTACGKRGAPLPPLVRIPAAPADFTVERRGEDVTLQFTVPAANTDGSRPANIERIDVYAFSGPATVNDEQLVKFGTKVASLPVKAPRDPDAATERDEPPEEPDLEAEGLDQGAVATLEDPLTPAAFQPVVLPEDKRGKSQAGPDGFRPPGVPLVGPPPRVDSRIYVLVPLNTRGRRGSLSPRKLIPLVPKPGTPATPAIAYDEEGINVSWPLPPAAGEIQPPATGDLLPGRYIGMETSSYAYHVYDVSPPAASDIGTTASQLAKEVRLTSAAVTEPLFHDTRMDFGATRCYTVRIFETIAGLTLQSDAPAPACVTLVDTFPPDPPKELQTVASEGAIDLIWEPSAEKDVTGYIVLRGTTAAGKLDEIKRLSAGETTFTDTVKTGAQYEYAVQAIDKAGNISAMSNRKGDSAR